MKLLFWISVSLLFYIYVGYFIILKLVSFVKGQRGSMNPGGDSNSKDTSSEMPMVSVIVLAYNEEKTIQQRINNLLALDYPAKKLEIIVASDGSTDKTVSISRQSENRGVNVLDFKVNRGRASVQNDAVQSARGTIIIFTDSESEFDKYFIRKLTPYFIINATGCVVGNLHYRTKKTAVSQSEGYYWMFEKKLRTLESSAGILTTGTGACMAVRSHLWEKLTPIDDCDFTTPLDIVLQGYKVIYAPDAVAYDIPPASLKGEFKARVRMTSKNLIGTLRRWSWSGWFKHPVVSWGLLSHKILRWFTSYFLLVALISNFALLGQGTPYQILLAGQLSFYVLALVGYYGDSLNKRIPIASTVFSFCVAAAGMGVGVVKGILGKAPAAYRMEE